MVCDKLSRARSNCTPAVGLIPSIYVYFATGYALLCNKTLQVCRRSTPALYPHVSHSLVHTVLCLQSVNLASNQLTATAAFVIAVAIKKNQYLR